MSFYENVFITRQELGDKDIKGVISNLTAILKKSNASVMHTEMWGLRNLAYKIDKNKKGHYIMLQIEGDGAAIKELERNMRIDENIIRFLSLKIDSISQEPSIMVKKTLEPKIEENEKEIKKNKKKKISPSDEKEADSKKLQKTSKNIEKPDDSSKQKNTEQIEVKEIE
tara:strand:- start:167 stop:673 length:507 start_codon:yes stop_codon:yes gene_type:complete